MNTQPRKLNDTPNSYFVKWVRENWVVENDGLWHRIADPRDKRTDEDLYLEYCGLTQHAICSTTPPTAQEGVSKEEVLTAGELNQFAFDFVKDFTMVTGHPMEARRIAEAFKQGYKKALSLPTTTSKAEGEDRWVSVEDGLPDSENDSTAWAELKDYLVANDNGVKKHSFKFSQKGFWRIKDGDHFAVKLPTITHWMPLPNPPKK